MKTNRTIALCFYFALAAALLLGAASMSAQITAFDGANEMMMTEQSTFLSFLGSTFGTDPASKLHFSHVVDPGGQSFSFSLDSGSTYLGQPITLSVSGVLDSSDQWHVSSSGSYAGKGFDVESEYISALSSGYGLPHTPTYIGATSNIYFAQGWGIKPTCCFYPIYNLACIDVWSIGNTDYQYCYYVNPATQGPFEETAFYQYSHGMKSADQTDWGYSGANTGANYWGLVDSQGTTFTNGSQGTSTSVLSPLSISTSTYFTDLGSGANVYNPSEGWQVSGIGAVGGTFTAASPFTATASGPVSRIDIGIGHVSDANSFYAALYSDNAGMPGTILARWDNLASHLDLGLCCGVVSIPVSGVSLAAGNPYYLVIGPTDIYGAGSMSWNKNSQSATGNQFYSTDGGGTWNSDGQQLLGAFDVVMQPRGIMVEAEQFHLSSPTNLTQVDLGLGYVSGDNAVQLVIAADNGGQPGTWLYQSSSFNVNQHYAGCCGLAADVIGGLNLAPGNYWLMVMPSSMESGTMERWYRNSTSATGLGAFSLDGGVTWNGRGQQLLGAFDLRSFDNVVYSNLGTDDSVYQCCSGYLISGGTNAPKGLPSNHGVKPAAPAGRPSASSNK